MSNVPQKNITSYKGTKSSSNSSSKNLNSLTNFPEILSSSHSDENKILQQNYDSYNVLSSYYNKKDNNSHFMEKISKFNTKFYTCSEKYLLAKSNLEKLNDDLYLNLFKQIDCYVEEIQRLNKKISECDNNKDYKKIIKDLNKEILEKKDIIRNLEVKISKKNTNEEKLQKEIDSYKRRIIFYKDKIKIRLGARRNSHFGKNNSKSKFDQEDIKNNDIKYRPNLNSNEHHISRARGSKGEFLYQSEGNSCGSSTKNIHNFSVGRENESNSNFNNNKNDIKTIYSDKEDENDDEDESKHVNKKLKESIFVNKKLNSIPRSNEKNTQNVEKNKDDDIEEPEKVEYLRNNYSPSTNSFDFNSDTEITNKYFSKQSSNVNFCYSDNENGEETKKSKEKNKDKNKDKKESKAGPVNKDIDKNTTIKSNNKTLSHNSQAKINFKKNIKSKVFSASKIDCKKSAEYSAKAKLTEKVKIKIKNDNSELRQSSTRKYYNNPLSQKYNLYESKEMAKEKNLGNTESKKNSHHPKLKNEKNTGTISTYRQGNVSNLNEKTKKMDKTVSGFNSHHNQNIPKPTSSNISRKLTKEKFKNDNELMKIFNELNDDYSNNIEMLSRQEDQIKFMLSLFEK